MSEQKQIHLSDEEEAFVRRYASSKDVSPQQRKRAQILLLANLGFNPVEIAQEVELSFTKAIATIKRALKGDIKSVVVGPIPPGRNSKFNEQERDYILGLLQKGPRAVGIEKDYWSYLTLRDYIRQDCWCACLHGLSKIEVSELKSFCIIHKIRLRHKKRGEAQKKIQLSDEELNWVEQFKASKELTQQQRARIDMLLFAHQGLNVYEAKKIVPKIAPKSFYNVIERYLQGGIALAILGKPPPELHQPKRHDRYSKEDIDYIEKIAKARSSEYGNRFRRWSYETLKRYIQKHAVDDGHPALRKIGLNSIRIFCKERNVDFFYYIKTDPPEVKRKKGHKLHDRYSQSDIDYIVKVAHSRPSEYGHPFRKWNYVGLRRCLNKYAQRDGHESLSDITLSATISLCKERKVDFTLNPDPLPERKPRFKGLERYTTEDLEYVVKIATARPSDYGYDIPRWTIAKLLSYIKTNCKRDGFPNLMYLYKERLTEIRDRFEIDLFYYKRLDDEREAAAKAAQKAEKAKAARLVALRRALMKAKAAQKAAAELAEAGIVLNPPRRTKNKRH